MRKCSECDESYFDDIDMELYCRANGLWKILDDEDFEVEPEWCPLKKLDK